METLNNSHIGKFVVIRDTYFNSVKSGTYLGTRSSQHDGKLYCYFGNGEINGVKQTNFGFPFKFLSRVELLEVK